MILHLPAAFWWGYGAGFGTFALFFFAILWWPESRPRPRAPKEAVDPAERYERRAA